MTRVLVTGGAGFIGSHTVEALLARGDEVWVLDNFNDFYDPAIKRANAAALDGAHIVEGDIRDEGCLDALFEEGRFDGVIHLAARKLTELIIYYMGGPASFAASPTPPGSP